MRISIYFWVALGGALGSMGRYWMGLRIATLTGLAFPWGTILINILGSLVIGFLATPGGLQRFSADNASPLAVARLGIGERSRLGAKETTA